MKTIFQREYPIPASLKEVLGARQSVGALLCIALMTTLAAALWSGADGLASAQANFVRRFLAWLLMLDIAAGAVANFTPGTNAFYAHRPSWRWGFIALHVHLPAVGWLLGVPVSPLLWVWAYTIATACLVNSFHGRTWQPVLGGCLLCVGVLVISFLALPPWQTSLSLLFLIKVLYAFAVNHYPERKVEAR